MSRSLIAAVTMRSADRRGLSLASIAALTAALISSRMGRPFVDAWPRAGLVERRVFAVNEDAYVIPNPTENKMAASGWHDPRPTALLVLADGTVIEGHGIGAEGEAVGEVCFNTAMTGYQEILTDPSYAGQIITFTFPHIGNVGVNDEDIETVNMAAASGVRGCVAEDRHHRAVELPRDARTSTPG